jgi:hypothetical protein
MNRYLPKVKERKVKNLLSGTATDAAEEVEVRQLLPLVIQALTFIRSLMSSWATGTR